MEGVKIILDNVGVLRHAEFEPGRLTVLCGLNNTGKTYATYAFYGFLEFFHNIRYFLDFPSGLVDDLIKEGSAVFPLREILPDWEGEVMKFGEQYSKELYKILAKSRKSMTFANCSVELFKDYLIKNIKDNKMTFTLPAAKISFQIDGDDLLVSLFADISKFSDSNQTIAMLLSISIKHFIFGNIFPSPIIFTAERTGIAIFQTELDFSRSKMWEDFGRNLSGDNEISPSFSVYAKPIHENINFMRRIRSQPGKESFIMAEHAALMDEFYDIIGGVPTVVEERVVFIPSSNKNALVELSEVSSSVRSLLALAHYLRHEAVGGAMVIIDEPELNLHPENQRRMARLLARLCNLGLDIFITTHSDYLVKELNILVMLNNKTSSMQALREKNGYRQEELLSFRDVKIYVTQEDTSAEEDKGQKYWTLVPAEGDEKNGFNVKSFNSTIDDMNRLENEILFFGEYDD